jgi:hypothetical protein
VDEDPIALLPGFAIGRAAMIDPACRVAALGSVDHAAVVQIDEECVAILGGRPADPALCILCRDDLTLILDDLITRVDYRERENASTMDQRGLDCNATHSVFSQG